MPFVVLITLSLLIFWIIPAIARQIEQAEEKIAMEAQEATREPTAMNARLDMSARYSSIQPVQHVQPLGNGPPTYTFIENGQEMVVTRGTQEYNDLWQQLPGARGRQ